MSERRHLSRQHLIILGGIGVLLIAGWMRLWQLSQIPPGLFGDEAANGLDALDVLAGRGQVFFPGNYGREGLQMWILAFALRTLGVTPWAVRLPSALAGTIAVLGAYWLGYELFVAPLPADASWRTFRDAWLTTLAAGLFTAFSFYHVLFSRFGARVIFTSTMVGLTLAALWRALRLGGFVPEPGPGSRRAWIWWGLAGACLGLANYFYSVSRFLPLMLGLFAMGWLGLSLWGVSLHPAIHDRKRFIKAMVLFFGVAALIFAPLGHYFLTHPGSFTQRAQAVSPLRYGQGWAALGVVARAAGLNLLQFIWPGHGDMARFHNLPGRAVFMPLTAGLALLGLGISLKRWRDVRYSFLLLWFLVMASPSFLAVDRAPTLPRVIGTTPGIFFFPAIGLVQGLRFIEVRLLRPLSPAMRRGLYTGLFLVALLWPAAITYRDYFQVWGPAAETADAFEIDMTMVWQWLQAHPPSGPLYVSADIYKHPTFIFLYEQTPTSEYFTRLDPQLHWFDARRAWPLPRPGATILVGNSAMPPPRVQDLLGVHLEPLSSGAAYVATTSFSLPTTASPLWLDERVGLMVQMAVPPRPGEDRGLLLQIWQVRGPLPRELAPYRIEAALTFAPGEPWVQVSDEMGVRPPEWEPNGTWITWQWVAPWPQHPPTGLAVRLSPYQQPPLQTPGARDGWIQHPWLTWDGWLTRGQSRVYPSVLCSASCASSSASRALSLRNCVCSCSTLLFRSCRRFS